MRAIIKFILVISFLLFTVNCTLFTVNSFAEIPHLINYQGRLTDKSTGKPLEGTYEITFRVYDAETAGTLLWQGTYSVLIQKGIFSVFLGDKSDTGYDFSRLTFDKQYFLEIKVGNEVMSPRQRITSAGYTIRAEVADSVKAGSIDKTSLATSVSSYLVPPGTIVMWSGPINTIPAGWALCDGTNGTPDLRDRFIIGARQDDNGVAKSKITGTLAQSGGSTNQPPKTSGWIDGSNPGVRNDYTNTNPVQQHKHNFIPPFYALAYIMKL